MRYAVRRELLTKMIVVPGGGLRRSRSPSTASSWPRWSVPRAVDDMFQNAVPADRTVKRGELTDLIPDGRLDVHALGHGGELDAGNMQVLLTTVKIVRFARYSAAPLSQIHRGSIGRFCRPIRG